MALSGSLSPIRETVKGLCSYLDANVTILEKVYDQFPGYDQKMVYPCASVLMVTPKYESRMPYVIHKGPIVETGSGPTLSRTAVTRRVIGLYELGLKIDLWCAYKPQRDSVVADIMAAINIDPESMGLNLELASYYGEFVHFAVKSVEYLNDEASVQRGECRAFINVLAIVRDVQVKSEHIFETIENTLQTPAEIAAPDDDEIILPI